MKRISKAVREEAIFALLSCADQRIGSGRDYGDCTDEVIGRGAADDLANSAYEVVANALATPLRRITMVEEYSEAAALLRDGWSPGEPVVRLKGGES